MTSSEPVIEVKGLFKSFGMSRALRGIDLTVSAGECLAVFGPNGAGKTTLIKVLSTLSKLSSGQVRLAGFDISKEAADVRRRIGVVSHQTYLYDNLSVYENLAFYGKMYDVPDLKNRISLVVEEVGMAGRLHHRVGVLSRGMQQRISLARAVLHDPPIMLLDEPDTGLDRYAAQMLAGLIKPLTSGRRTVIVTTHNLSLGLALSDRVMILNRGKVSHDGLTGELDLPALQQIYERFAGVPA